ncbi:MAG: PP2C family serine/threonine-protein phosphatase [Saprospiraceae bacterium]|jgi:serine/threonine protein phosphatase PrpC
MKWKIAGSSVIGLSHIKNNIPCQDHISILDNDDCFCISLADGAGSAKFAELGASIVTSKTCELILQYFDKFFLDEAKEVREKIIHVLRTNLGMQAKVKEAVKRDFASTLLFVAVKGENFIAGHIGDGIIGYVKGNELITLSPPENGEYINETYFVTSNNYQRNLRLFKGEVQNINGFVLMSDGTCESLFDKANRSLAPVVKEIIEWLDENSIEVVTNALKSNLEEVIRNKTLDDCSLAIMKKVNKKGDNNALTTMPPNPQPAKPTQGGTA